MTATAKVSRVVPASPTEVWETLTSKEGMKAYMFGADVDTDWQVGSPITMKGEFNGKPFEDRGELRSFEPGKRFSYTHQGQHLVTVELKPEGDGSEVTIIQENLDGGVTETDRQHKAEYEKTWSAMLEGVEKAVAS